MPLSFPASAGIPKHRSARYIDGETGRSCQTSNVHVVSCMSVVSVQVQVQIERDCVADFSGTGFSARDGVYTHRRTSASVHQTFVNRRRTLPEINQFSVAGELTRREPE